MQGFTALDYLERYQGNKSSVVGGKRNFLDQFLSDFLIDEGCVLVFFLD
ncbi:hypothetical protein SORDD16_01311 [Streptococcus oralis]|uniref:Uncharacterized protein n=1 Tax=Streptococcus oralis TaxID=1303 RepID=A0A139PC75_STROR|nr:hypothetical protein SORDD16_01311 [Streptococcus oralis]